MQGEFNAPRHRRVGRDMVAYRLNFSFEER